MLPFLRKHASTPGEDLERAIRHGHQEAVADAFSGAGWQPES